jgi:serine/threonine protein kinase
MIKILGKGGFGIVYYAKNKKTGKKVALKIIKSEIYDNFSIEEIKLEVEILKELDHENLTRLLDYGTAQLKTSNRSKEVFYVAIELANGGELFDFIALTGEFSEDVARYYFRQLIEGLDYMHQNGISHRDLKTENILLDKKFKLKIADFGYASQKGTNWTQVGTPDYMAPEVLKGKKYNGHCVDVFGAGLILFLMVTKNKPFLEASDKDPYYKNIVGNRPEKFWSIHLKSYGKEFLSTELKDLIENLFNKDPVKRYSMSEIKSHPWYVKDVPSESEIKKEFKERRVMLKEQLKEAESEESEKMEHDPEIFDGLTHRSLDGLDSAEEDGDVVRVAEEYDPDFSRITQFFSEAPLEDIWF